MLRAGIGNGRSRSRFSIDGEQFEGAFGRLLRAVSGPEDVHEQGDVCIPRSRDAGRTAPSRRPVQVMSPNITHSRSGAVAGKPQVTCTPGSAAWPRSTSAALTAGAEDG